MATGLVRNSVLKALDLMSGWLVFLNLFPDAITLNEQLRCYWKNSQRELGFPNFPAATLVSNDEVSYP